MIRALYKEEKKTEQSRGNWESWQGEKLQF